MFKKVLNTSILKRAQEKKLVEFELINLRDFGIGKRKQVDDTPYGGGAGMVLRVDVIDRALSSICSKCSNRSIRSNRSKRLERAQRWNERSDGTIRTILLTPQGKVFNQKIAKKLSKENNLVLICGHYEGFDERVRQLADEEISIGEYVLTGGELPAMVLIDTITRLIPGVLGNKESLSQESFSTPIYPYSSSIPIHPSSSLLEYPQYTKPPICTLRSTPSTSLRTSQDKKIKKVPAVLLSGNHAQISQWRSKQSLNRTRSKKR